MPGASANSKWSPVPAGRGGGGADVVWNTLANAKPGAAGFVPISTCSLPTTHERPFSSTPVISARIVCCSSMGPPSLASEVRLLLGEHRAHGFFAVLRREAAQRRRDLFVEMCAHVVRLVDAHEHAFRLPSRNRCNAGEHGPV